MYNIDKQMTNKKCIFPVLIFHSCICILLIKSEHILRRSDQYEKSEILEHEDHREILKDTKTIFLPEKIIFFKMAHREPRKKRNFDCKVFGSNPNYCTKENKLKENDDWRTSELGKINSSVPYNDSFLNLPELQNKSDTDNTDLENDEKSVLMVKVNITFADDYKDQIENSAYGFVDQNSSDDERQIFWHNQKSKEEIRNLQSKIMRKYMNHDADPCVDFYSYACGNWKKFFTIPPDKSTYDTFEIIRENLDLVLNDILKNQSEILQNPDELKKPLFKHLFTTSGVSNVTLDAKIKAKYFYESCMKEDVILKRGSKPLLKILEDLGGWPIISNNNWCEERYDLFRLLARLRLLNNDVLISQWIGPDMKNSNKYIVHIDQTTLGLPSREYFLDSKNIKYIRAYKILILSTVQLLGANLLEAEKDVDDIIDFEIQLAQIMASSEERRNISDVYLRTDVASMSLYFPQFDWKSYFDIVLGSDADLQIPVAVYCVKYLLELVYLLTNTNHRILQNYLIWRFVRHRLNNLDSRFLDVKQRFSYVLYGREKQPQRWQFCVTQVNTHMGMALGSLFVRQYFDRTSKIDTIQMTKALTESFKNILEESSWLDDHTRQYARMKIDNMDLKIGFPDFVLNDTELSMRYYDVEIHPDFFFENVLSILRHLTRVEQKRLGSVVNRTLWSTSPAVVNAYYSRNKNQIMFPAGILQPPFYHKYFPKAMNFGGIGVVIGHEITHGFDDKGRLFDQEGNLMMWWRESSIKNFYEKAQCMIDQYSQYVLPEIKVALDGYLTQGENIADNGGLKQSFKSYENWLLKNPKVDETLPGLKLTGKQLFFLNFAQVWCGQQRIEEAKNRLKTSVHSPGLFRIIGVLSNSEDFAKAFNCPRNTPMNPEKKCTLW